MDRVFFVDGVGGAIESVSGFRNVDRVRESVESGEVSGVSKGKDVVSVPEAAENVTSHRLTVESQKQNVDTQPNSVDTNQKAVDRRPRLQQKTDSALREVCQHQSFPVRTLRLEGSSHNA